MEEADYFGILLRAGLWHRSISLSKPWPVLWKRFYDIAEEQALVPIISDGMEILQAEYVSNGWWEFLPSKMEKRPFVLDVFRTEGKNEEVLRVLVRVTDVLRKEQIHYFLMKGAAVGRFYVVPERRKPGDIDLYVLEEEYERAKSALIPLSSEVNDEYSHEMHQGLCFTGTTVEIHGSNDTFLSNRIDKALRKWRETEFERGGDVWQVNSRDISVASPIFDIVYVFAHCLQHFYRGGVGLRQFCDLSRLLSQRACVIDRSYLKTKLQEMRLMGEWKAVGCFLVRYIGLQQEDMPFYDSRYEQKGELICRDILTSGNFGSKRKTERPGGKNLFIKRLRSFGIVSRQILHAFPIFPRQSLRTYSYGVWLMVKGRVR
jgi:hypothetical protein